MNERWVSYFQRLTEEVATQSTCMKRSVGAVLIRDKRILATGYNGNPSGMPHCTTCARGESGTRLDLCSGVHAEANAIYQCAKFGIVAEGTDMFCTTFPCNECLKGLLQIGVKRLFYRDYYLLDEQAEQKRIEMLENSNLEVRTWLK